jgi:hypothetical protein
MKFFIDTGEMRIESFDGNELTLGSNSAYEYIDIPGPNVDYQITLPKKPNWYYATLTSITKDMGTKTNLTLLAPQPEADKE